MLVRVGRNTVLVLALLIPILAGLGLNFGIVIGAMAGQLAAILVVHWGGQGIGGFGAARPWPLRWRSGSGYSRGCSSTRRRGARW